jgi:hypothetical protein
VVSAADNPQLLGAANGRVVWSPSIALAGSQKGFRLCLQPDGGLTLRDNGIGRVVWSASYPVPSRSQLPLSLVVDSGKLRVLDSGCGTLYNGTAAGAAGKQAPSNEPGKLAPAPTAPKLPGSQGAAAQQLPGSKGQQAPAPARSAPPPPKKVPPLASQRLSLMWR